MRQADIDKIRKAITLKLDFEIGLLRIRQDMLIKIETEEAKQKWLYSEQKKLAYLDMKNFIEKLNFNKLNKVIEQFKIEN